jgi:hypothetical protein
MAATEVSPLESRPLHAVILHAEQELRFAIDNKLSHTKDPDIVHDRKAHYQQVVAVYAKQKKLSKLEKQTLQYLKHEIRRLDAQLSKAFGKRLRYSTGINWLFNALIGRQGNYDAHIRYFASYQKEVSVNHNYDRLKQTIERYGFKQSIEKEIKGHMQHGVSEFSVPYIDPNIKNAYFILDFKQIEGSNVYYFSGFKAMTHNPDSAAVPDGRIPRQLYSVRADLQFSAQEAANITNGRPVRKDVDGTPFWHALDLFRPAELIRIEFDLEAALKKLPIVELADPVKKSNLLNALYNGSKREVTLELPGGVTEKLRISIKTQANGFNFYNQSDKRIDPAHLLTINPQAKKLQQVAEQATLKETTTQKSAKVPKV